jgi:hypothetical protein
MLQRRQPRKTAGTSLQLVHRPIVLFDADNGRSHNLHIIRRTSAIAPPSHLLLPHISNPMQLRRCNAT